MTTNTLSSLAMLKVSVNAGKDYLSYLNPYIIHIFTQEQPNATVTDKSVSEKLRDLFGFEIPSRTVQVILKRFARKNFITKDNHIYRINHKDLPNDNIPTRKAEVDRHIAQIVNELMSFAKSSANLTINEKQAHQAIIAFLEQFSVPFLRSFLRGTVFPSHDGDKTSRELVLIGQFIKQISEKTELFASFEKIVEGHMLANALLCPDLQEVSDNYSKTTFVIDTPIILQLLGFDGKQKEDAAKELISLVHNLKGNISYFSHTLEEVHNVLSFAIEHIDDHHNITPTIRAARLKGLSKADLVLKKEKTEENLSSLGIQLVNTPHYDLKAIKFNIDEFEFEKVLKEQIAYRGENAASYDVKSIRNIYVLRKGNAPVSVEKSVAIFVTDNMRLAKVTRQYEENIIKTHCVPSVITDFSLANMAWLKAPQGAPSLPRKEVLAFAYAASSPTTGYWEKVLSEIDKLEKEGKISPRDHQLLRSNQNVIDELMGLTLGDDSALTEQTILDTAQRISAEIKKEETEKLTQEKKAHQQTKNVLTERENELENIKTNCFWACKQQAEKEAKYVFWGAWVIFGSIALTTIVALFNFKNVFVTFILIVEAGIALFGRRYKLSPDHLRNKFSIWREALLLKKKYAELGITDPITDTSIQASHTFDPANLS